MSFDINALNGLSARELKTLIRTAQKQQDLVAKRPAVTKVRAQVNKILRESGYTVAELYDVDVPAPAPRGRKPGKVAKKAAKKAAKGAKGKSKGIVPPKYRNPANAGDTWTGRGKAPRWMADLLAKGKKKEDFLIG